MKEFTLPAGVYWIGDLCYVVDDEVWQKFLDEAAYVGNTMAQHIDGILYLAFDTEWGDGTYKDQYGNEYDVDASMIGIIPAADVDASDMPGGHIFDFKTEFTARRKENGLLVFGHVQIVTDGSDQPNDDDVGSW